MTVQWLGQTHYSWGASAPEIKQFHEQLNALLVPLGYTVFPATGVVGPELCGTMSVVGYEITMKNLSYDQVDNAAWNKMTGCIDNPMLLPTKAGANTSTSTTTPTTKTKTKTSWAPLVVGLVVTGAALAWVFRKEPT